MKLIFYGSQLTRFTGNAFALSVYVNECFQHFESMLLQGIYHSILTLHNNHYALLIKCNFHSSLSALVWMSDCHQLSSLILKTNYASYNTACGPFPRRESSKVQIPLSSNKNNIWVISSTLIQTWLTENVGQLKEALGQMRQNITFCQEISFF